MARFTADAEALHAAAGTVDRAVEAASTPRTSDTTPDTGHARLTKAVTGFATTVEESWADRIAAMRGIATGLRRTADIYESADADGEARVRRGYEAF